MTADKESSAAQQPLANPQGIALTNGTDKPGEKGVTVASASGPDAQTNRRIRRLDRRAEPTPKVQLDAQPTTSTVKVTEDQLRATAMTPGWPDAQPTPRTAKQQYDEFASGETLPPLEALRFFCSLSMEGKPQDWIDVEPFFDAIESELAAKDAELIAANERAHYEATWHNNLAPKLESAEQRLAAVEALLREWLSAKLSRVYEPWIESFTARVNAALATPKKEGGS